MGVYIIAEAGVNHNGSIELAKKLVKKAKEAGADCVKFQTFLSENLVTPDALKADYQKKNSDDVTQLEMLKKLELTYNEFKQLKNFCDEVGIDFISTPFDMESVDFLNKIDMKFWKIPSGEITNYPYLAAIAKTHKPIILSTGMSTIADIEDAVNLLRENNSGEITLLHCTTEYPAPFEEVNLYAMMHLKEKFACKVGYSDHTQGIEVSIAAAAMGAEVIEKHFTLDCNMEGPDHKASLEPKELKKMVAAIRNVHAALGEKIKKPTESELKNINIVRKSIVAKCDIRQGEYFSEENITTKRPGNGISPMKWKEVLGMAAKRDYKEDELIEL